MTGKMLMMFLLRGAQRVPKTTYSVFPRMNEVLHLWLLCTEHLLRAEGGDWAWGLNLDPRAPCCVAGGGHRPVWDTPINPGNTQAKIIIYHTECCLSKTVLNLPT